MKHKLNRMIAMMLAVILSFSMLLIPVEAASFRDVFDKDWYSAAVDYVHEKGWMNGVSETAFAPNTEVTRGMFVTVLARVAEADTDNSNPAFVDTPAGSWYTGAAAWAAQHGIVSGVGANRFAPNRSISRQDLCTILYRFIEAQDLELEASADRTFADMDSVSGYARQPVGFCVAAGLVSGFEDGTFRPKDTATRAQVAAILMRLDKLVNGEEAPADPMPAQNFEGEEQEGMSVSVQAPEGALPANTNMIVSPVTDEATLANLSEKVSGELVAAADISFTKDGDELEPQAPVEVRIALEGLENIQNPVVYHFKADGTAEPVAAELVSLTRAASSKVLRFYASDFSVYAVYSGGGAGANKLTVFFHANGSVINKQILRQDQLTDASNPTPIFDPGVPNISTDQSFEGWYKGTATDGGYSDSDTGVSVAEINETYHGMTLTGDIELHYYAMVYPVLYVTYHDQNGAVLMTESYHKNSSNQASVTINWPYVPFIEGQGFSGWTPDIVTKGENPTFTENPTVYQNGQTYTLTASLKLYPYVPKGHWITFDNNLAQNNTKNGFDDPTTASYTAPVFAASDVNPTRPTDPKRPGYTFGGWYANEDMTQSFNFNQPITANTTLYAKWTPSSTTYTIVYWAQIRTDDKNATDANKHYEYYKTSSARSATSCSSVSINKSSSGTTADNRLGGNDSDNIGEMGFGFKYNSNNTASKNGLSSDTDTVKVRGDGGTIINVYYDRKTITYTFKTDNYGSGTTYSGLYQSALSSPQDAGSGNQWVCTEINMYIGQTVANFSYLRDYRDSYTFEIKKDTSTSHKTVHEMVQGLNGTELSGTWIEGATFKVTNAQPIAQIPIDLFPGFTGYRYNLSSNDPTGPGSDAFPQGTGAHLKLAYSSYYVAYPHTDAHAITGTDAYVYFSRNQYVFTYRSNNEDLNSQTMYYGAPLTGLKDYVPTNGPDDCFFDGWYLDSGFVQPFNFNSTMPNANKIIFAKWTPKKYRVILNYDPDNLGVKAGSDAQASFLVNAGEQINRDALQNFTCNGKRLLGWYTDPEFKHPFNPESLIYDTVSDVNTYYGEKKPGEIDAAYKERMAGETRRGTDAASGASWSDNWDTDNPDSYAVERTVRSQLQLYALWRADPAGVIGMHVTYLGDNGADTGYFDVEEPEFHPHIWKDPMYYTDHSWAYAQPASVPDHPEEQQFLYWEILDNEGNPTGKKVYPGQTFEILFEDAYEGAEPPTNCEHTERVYVEAVAATCETAGNSAHYRCTNCGRRFASNNPEDTTVINPTIPALGHLWEDANKTYTWDSTVTPWTCTATATCSRNPAHTLTETVDGEWHVDRAPTVHDDGSGHYEASFENTSVFNDQNSDYVVIPQLTEVTVSFTVPNGVAPVAAISAEPGSSITLPSAGAPSGLTFLGWTNAPVSNASSAPSYSAPDADFTVPDENATLYALYSYTAASGSYSLLTSAPSDWSGNYVITAGITESMYVMKNPPIGTDYQSTSSGGHATFSSTGMTLSDNKLINVGDSYVFEIEPVTDNNKTYYTLKNRAANAWLNFSSSYVLALQSTDNSDSYWSLSYDSGGVKAIPTHGQNSYFLAWGYDGGFFGIFNSFKSGYETQLWKETTETKYTTGGDAISINFSVPSGVSAVSSISAIPGSTITLPTAGSITGYTFLGWTEDTLASETTTVPSSGYMLTDYVVPDHDVTLNALYTRSDAYYQLLTSNPGSYSGDYVITSGTDASAYMMGDLEASVNCAQISGTPGVTLSNSRLTGVPDANVFTFVSSGSGYTLRNKGNNNYVYINNSSLSANSTNSTVFTVSYYSSNFSIYYSASSVWGTYNIYMRYSNNKFSVSTTQSYLYLWQKHETLYYTTAPSDASGSILEPVQTVEPGQTEETAVLDLVSYNPSNPVRDGETETEYNIFLRAVYGRYNPDATTYINWYANNGTSFHNGAGSRYQSTGTNDSTPTRLDYNEEVPIPTPSTFEGDNGALYWGGHEFLGWARVPVTGSGSEGTAQTLTTDDLYLRWNGKCYEYNPHSDDKESQTDSWVELTSGKVYADGDMPHYDMYAVWGPGCFYVLHSATGKLEAIPVQINDSSSGTGTTSVVDHFDLTKLVSSGHLYGGYYTSYGGVSEPDVDAAVTEFERNSAQTTWTTDAGTSRMTYTCTAANASFEAYTGASSTSTQNNGAKFWTKAKAYKPASGATEQQIADVNGKTMRPVAGKVYYLKEVPEAYLAPKFQYVYDTAQDNRILNLFMLSVVDDSYYSKIGFKLAENDLGYADAASSSITVKTTLAKSFSVVQKGNSATPEREYKVVPSDFTGVSAGLISVLNLDDYIVAGKRFTMLPSWKTLDGVTVEGKNAIGITITALNELVYDILKP